MAKSTELARRLALGAVEYDKFWTELEDFIRYNPGARHRQRLIWRTLQHLKYARLLDVGCGKAANLIFLMKMGVSGVSCEGADLSPGAIEANRRKLPEVPFHVLDIEKEYLNRTYDLVTCCEVVEHLNDRNVAFSNLVRMVEPGGYLLITSPAGRVFETERHLGHTSHPDTRELEDLGRRHGLTVMHSLNWGWPLYFLLKRVINLNPRWSLREFASGPYGWTKRLIANVLYGVNYLNFSRSARGCQLMVLFRKNA